MRLVYGVGVNDKTRPAKTNGKMTREYDLWTGMIKRCYSEKYLDRFPTYKNCTMSKNFKSYSYFYDWCQNQIGFNEGDWQLDKDILKKGSKEYGEDSCIFIPAEINCMMVKSDSIRGDYPIGVSLDRRTGRFICQIKISNRKITIGRFDDIASAFNAYKVEKEAHIKNLAHKYRLLIDPRAYQSLLSYTVEIND